MSELIKSILVLHEIADVGTAPFCTLGRGVQLRNLPCHSRDDILCTYCMFAVGQATTSSIKAMERIYEKPK